MLCKSYIVSIFLLLMATSAFAQKSQDIELSCQDPIDQENGRDRHLPYWQDDQKKIIAIGYLTKGERAKESWCEDYIETRSGNLICSVTQFYDEDYRHFQPFDIVSGKMVVVDHHGYTDIDLCEDSISRLRSHPASPLICTFDAKTESYMAYNYITQELALKDIYSGDHLADCLDNLDYVESQDIGCFRHQGDWHVINRHGVVLSDTMTDETSCRALTTYQRDHHLCVPLSDGYRIVDAFNPELSSTGPAFTNLSDCRSMLFFKELGHLISSIPKPINFSFRPFVKASESDKNWTYPRNHELVYRGVEPKFFPLSQALMAMLGDAHQYVESKLFTAIKLKLMGELDNGENEYFIELMAETVRRSRANEWKVRSVHGQMDLENYIDLILYENGGHFHENQAKELVKNLVDHSFNYELKQNSQRLLERVGVYGSRYYEDFPIDVVFSSFYHQTAAIYGAGILILKDDPNDPRLLDMTYLNRRQGWRGRGDAGECVTPGYFKPSEIQGYEVHTRGKYRDREKYDVRYHEYSVQRSEPLRLAFYKHKLNAETFVLVFEGYDHENRNRNRCIRRDFDGIYKYCYHHRGTYQEAVAAVPAHWDHQILSNYPHGDFVSNEDGGRAAKFIGVIKLCPKVGACPRPQKVFNLPFLVNQVASSLPSNISGHAPVNEQISSVQIKGQKAVFFSVE